MKLEMTKNKELSPREKAKLKFVENLAPEVAKLRKTTGIGMTAAVVEILKKKGITAKEDIDYYNTAVPSFLGKLSARLREERKIEEARRELNVQALTAREENKRQEKQNKRPVNKENQLDLFT